jgi:PAS domain-containing protein
MINNNSSEELFEATLSWREKMKRVSMTFLLFALLYGGMISQLQAAQKLTAFTQVVISDSPLLSQKAVAEDLAEYVGKICGKSALPVISASKYEPSQGLSFFVGDGAASRVIKKPLEPWKDEEYLLQSVPEGLILTGKDSPGAAWSQRVSAGSMLAVYTLLDEYLGVKWFWPGPFGEHVPLLPNAVIPDLSIRATPRFMIRSISIGYASYHTKSFRGEVDRWAKRNRLGWTRSAVFGHSWPDVFNLRNDESFKAHPDWFALVKGKRRPPQMCTTHPEVINRMVEYVLNGKSDIVNISPSDGGGFCECTEETKSEYHKTHGIPSCTSLDIPGLLAYDNKSVQLSDRIFTYANEVARRVAEKNPKKACGIHAYTYYNKPPVKITKLEPNLYISFVYHSANHRDPVAYAQWKESVAGWQKLGATMVMREGWGDHYTLNLPYLHYNQIIANIAEGAKLGFIAIYGEGGKAFATQSPNYWAITRMMWNPTQDTKTLMDEYWRSAYGPAAKEMKAFFETYSQALDTNWEKRKNRMNSWNIFFPSQVLDEAEKHLVAAEKKVSSGEYSERVAFHRFGQEYTRTMLELFDCYQKLAELGMKMSFFSDGVETPRIDEEEKAKLLQEAYRLGEKREELLLAHLDWAAVDEGLYAFTNDTKRRQWHSNVKKALGIKEPSKLTKEYLKQKEKERKE